MKTKLSFIALVLCFSLGSCSDLTTKDLETNSPQRQCLNELTSLSEDDIIYGDDYVSLFGLLHNEGAEYVLESLQNMDYKYFSDINDTCAQTIMNLSLLYVDQIFSQMSNPPTFYFDNYDYIEYSLSSDVDHLLSEIRYILSSELPLLQQYDLIEDLYYEIINYNDKDYFISSAALRVALSSLTYWSNTINTLNVFINDDVVPIIYNNPSYSNLEDVIMEDIEATARALGITIDIYLNCGALVNLIGVQNYLIVALGTTVGYAVFKSVCKAIEKGKLETLNQVDHEELDSNNSCYEYLYNKYLINPELFDYAPYQRFIDIFSPQAH